MEFSKALRKRRQDKEDQHRKNHQLVLTMEESFGCLQRTLNCNSFIVGSSLLYINGNFLILHNIIQSNKKLLQKMDHQETVTALSYYSEVHINIAVAAISKKLATLSVYCDFDEAVYTYTLGTQERITDLLFVSAYKLLALSEDQHGSSLIIRKDPKSCSPKEELVRVRLSKKTTKIAQCVLGKTMLCCGDAIIQLDLNEQSFKCETLLEEPKIVSCVTYENEVCVLLTEDSIVSYKAGEKVQAMNLKELMGQDLYGSCLIRFSKGFFIGFRNKIAVSLFLLENGTMRYAQTYSLKEKTKGGVVSMHVSSDQMYIALTALIGEGDFKPNPQPPSYLENMVFNLTNITIDKVPSNPFNRIFKNSLDYGQIIAMKGSVTPHCFSLVNTNLLVYSYSDYFCRQSRFNLNETPSDIAIHPLGFQIVCIFKDSLRVYMRLEKDLIEIVKIHRSCTSVQYSEGGILAVGMVNNSYHEVGIFQTIKFGIIKIIECFSSKYPISKIYWRNDDSQLHVYSGQQFHILNVYQDSREMEFYQKKKTMTCMHYDQGIGSLFVAFSDGLIRIYNCIEPSLQHKQTEAFEISLPIQFQLQDIITSLCLLPNKVIIFGTTSGKIKWTSWPFQKGIQPLFDEICVGESVSQMFLASLKYLVVGTLGGTMHVLRLRRKKENILLNIQNDSQVSKFKDIVVYSKASLEQAKEKLKNLLQKRGSYLNELEELKKEEEARQANDLEELQNLSQQQQRRNLREIVQTLQSNNLRKAAIKKEHALLNKKRLADTADWLERDDRQMLNIYRTAEQLHVELRQLQDRVNAESIEAHSIFNRNLSQIKNELSGKLNNGQQIVDQLREAIRLNRVKKDFTKKERQLQEQLYRRAKRQELLQQEKIMTKDSNESKAKISKLQKEIDRYGLRRDFLQNKKKYLQNQFAVEEAQFRTLQQLKNSIILELINLEDATNKRQQMIRDFSDRNDKLSNFREVYCYLQSSLQSQTQTLKDYSAVLSVNIQKINSELVPILSQNNKLQQKTKILQIQRDKLISSLKEQEGPLTRLRDLSKSVLHALSMMPSPLGSSDWKSAIKDILNTVVRNMKFMQKLSKSSRIRTSKESKFLESMEEHNLQMVRNNLTYQRRYLQVNINRFAANHRVLQDDLTSTYLKLQAKNSNLITQCNILKEKLHKKGKNLNELMNSLKMGESVIQNMEKEGISICKTRPPQNTFSLADWFPAKERQSRKNSQIPYLRVKRGKPEGSTFTETRCETIINIRRINTAEKSIANQENFDENSKPATGSGCRTSSKRQRILRRTATGSGFRSTTADGSRRVNRNSKSFTKLCIKSPQK